MKIGDTVYTTEHALTEGVKEKKFQFLSQIHDPHTFASRENAVKHAEEMRNSQIALLKDQIEKLEGMNFEGRTNERGKINNSLETVHDV